MSYSKNIHPNVVTSFNPHSASPQIDPTAFIHHFASVIGDVSIGKNVFVAPFASLRGDEGVPIHIGDDSNVQDGVVLHALETFNNGDKINCNLKTVDGHQYAIYIGRRVSLAHQCQVHGPSVVLDSSFIAMQALVFRATIGRNCVIEPAARVMNVDIPDNRFVPTGAIINSQAQADNLSPITPDYPFCSINDSVIKVNTQLAQRYRQAQQNNPNP